MWFGQNGTESISQYASTLTSISKGVKLNLIKEVELKPIDARSKSMSQVERRTHTDSEDQNNFKANLGSIKNDLI